MLLNFLSADTPAFGVEQILLIALVLGLVLILFVLPVFTNKKRQKSVDDMYGSLKAGDKIMTIGGIIGVVTAINTISDTEKHIVIETGDEGNKTSLTLDIKALFQIIPPFNPNANINTEAENIFVDSASNASEVEEQIVVQEEDAFEEEVKPEPEKIEEAPAPAVEVAVEEPAAKEEPEAVKDSEKSENSEATQDTATDAEAPAPKTKTTKAKSTSSKPRKITKK